jgi:hypothetical protein
MRLEADPDGALGVVDAPQTDANFVDSLRGSVGRRLGLHQDELSIEGSDIGTEVDLLTFHHLIGDERCAPRVRNHIEAVDIMNL